MGEGVTGRRIAGGSGPEPTRPFFRLVASDPPSREDFLSYFDLGLIPARATDYQIDLYKGVSMFETEAQARAQVPRMRRALPYVAEVSVPASVRAVRQGRTEGHHNIYADPNDLLAWVVRVVPA